MAQKIKKLSKKFIALVCMFTLVFSYSVVGVNESKADALTVLKDTISDSRATEANVMHSILFNSTSAIPSVTGTIVIDFPAGFNLTTHAATDMNLYTHATANPPTTGYTLADTTPTTTAAGVVVDNTLETITITMCSTADETCAIEAGDYVLLTIGDGAAAGDLDIVNPALGVYLIDIDTTSDSGSIAVAILGADSGVSVTATIDSYLTFTINTETLDFGSWTGGTTEKRWATSAAGGATADPGAGNAIRIDVDSNGEGGASITARRINGYLDKTEGTADTIAAATAYEADEAGAVQSGTEGYGIYATYISAGAGPFTIEDEFDNDASSQAAIDTTNQVIAISTAVPLSSSIIDVDVVAAINGTTLAGVYSDTLVFVTTGTF